MAGSSRIEKLEEQVAHLRKRLAELEPAAPTENAAVNRLLRERDVLESIPDVIMVANREYRVLYLNRTIPGRRASDVIGTSALDYIPEPERARYVDAFEQAWSTGAPRTLEVASVSGYVWETRLVPVVDAGNVAFMLSTSTDISDRKRLEERLGEVRKMEAIGQLTAGIAHHFNNLLTVILPNVALCRMNAEPEDAARLDDVEQAAKQAAEMVRQLMLFARSDPRAGKSPVDLVAAAGRTVNICRTTFDPEISFELTAGDAVPAVIADARQLDQVLLNIFSNAGDALEAAAVAAPKISIGIDALPPDRVRIRVTDNGPGMTEEIRSRVFEPFFTTKAIGRGTGLGLASAYAIVTDHRGQIACESRLGEGTTFEIVLPSETAPKENLRRRATTPHVGSETILMIDDEALVRRAVRAILEHNGYLFLEAANGYEGLATFERDYAGIDLVILDRSMPGLSGSEVLARLTALDKGIPVLLLSGLPEDAADGPPVAAVLTKPMETPAFLRTIREILDGKKAN